MRGTFQQQDWIAPPALRVDGNYENNLKYFNESDQSIAQEIKQKTEQFLAKKKCNKNTINLDKKTNSNREEGQIEIWIHSSCELKE